MVATATRGVDSDKTVQNTIRGNIPYIISDDLPVSNVYLMMIASQKLSPCDADRDKRLLY
jgi:hypothetical protein